MAKVWVTRDEEPGGPLSTALTEAGLQPVLEPVVTRTLISDITSDLATLNANDWLVLTSPFAIQHVPLELACGLRLAVVGEGSRQVAEARGLSVDFTSTGPGAKALFNELASQARGVTICYPRSSQAEVPELPADVTLISPIMYDTRPRAFRQSVIEEIDTAAFASPSAVHAVGVIEGLKYASIGPTTSEAMRVLGIDIWLESPSPRFNDFARALAAALA